MKSHLLHGLIALIGLGLALSHHVTTPARDVIAAETQAVTIRFQAMVGEQPFNCGESYALGTSATSVTPTDFRFYVSDVALIDNSGAEVPVVLEQDGRWQYQSVALLDFEDKSATCSNGTQEMRDQIVGTVPVGTYRSVRFTLGVPFALNHADATLAPSPLNLTSLWWNWQGGYKFLRVDLANAAMTSEVEVRQASVHSPSVHNAGSGASETGHSDTGQSSQGHETLQGFAIHLGSTACEASTNRQSPTSCANPNRTEVMLNNFDPDQNIVVADLAALVASTDLATNQPDTPAGCMASPNDGDCLGIMHNVGLSFGGQPSTGQTFFRVK